MTVIESLDLSYLTSIFVFADTPGYLYRYYRRNNSIINLSKLFSQSELISVFTNIFDKENKELVDLVVCYSIIIGLTFFSYDQVVNIFNNLELGKLEWGNIIKDYYVFPYKSFHEINITVSNHAVNKSQSTDSISFLASKPNFKTQEI